MSSVLRYAGLTNTRVLGVSGLSIADLLIKYRQKIYPVCSYSAAKLEGTFFFQNFFYWHAIFMQSQKKDMKIFTSLIGGFIGAATVTILNESLRRLSREAPRLDKLGEEAASKTIEAFGGNPPTGDTLYVTSMGADLLSNMVYYSSAGAHPDNSVLAGAGLGVLAGIGAVYLPEQIGLNEEHTARTDARKWVTIAMYTLGGLIAGAVINRMSK